MLRHSLAAALLLATPTIAVASDETPAADPARLKADVAKLVSFGTRHTLSSATDPKRGIGAARTWGASEFERISKACGGCLTVSRIVDRFEGPRAPDGVIVRRAHQVLAETITLLEQIEDHPRGLLDAIGDGTFGLMSRPPDGGRGLDGVAVKAEDYYNPATEILEQP